MGCHLATLPVGSNCLTVRSGGGGAGALGARAELRLQRMADALLVTNNLVLEFI